MANRKYNWQGLFDRRYTVLVRGEDYHCSQSIMAQMVRNAASKRGKRVHLTDTGEALIIEVVSEIQYPHKAPVAG